MLFNFFKKQKKEQATAQLKKYDKAVLLVFDGFGVNPKLVESPWKQAAHPNFEIIEKFYPFTALQASGIAVGLPYKEEGNSEVGHLSIGSGRIIYSYLPRISSAIEDGSFFKNNAFIKAAEKVKTGRGKLHLVGLFSSGSVHASYAHLYALLNFAVQENVPKVFLHLFTDGRDASQKEGADFIKKLERKIENDYPNAKIASLIGRDFAMDRDGHWDKIETTYKLLTKGEGEKFSRASDYLNQKYAEGISDEFIPPAVFSEENAASQSEANGNLKNEDAVIFFNFREDSMREIASAFVDEEFSRFDREDLNDCLFITMTEYFSLVNEEDLESENPSHRFLRVRFKNLAAFPHLEIKNTLGEILSVSGLKQMRIAETEKYAHVTYFFNGGRENPFPGEERILIPSPRVSDFAERPEMSADQIADEVIKNLDKNDFILANFANADMVGHTGDFSATIKAFETLDSCAGRIMKETLKLDAVLMITGDHGNAEEKIYAQSGEAKTKHSINPVPFYLIADEFKLDAPKSEEEIKRCYEKVKGSLSDIAPTALALLEIQKPYEMQSRGLLHKVCGEWKNPI